MENENYLLPQKYHHGHRMFDEVAYNHSRLLYMGCLVSIMLFTVIVRKIGSFISYTMPTKLVVMILSIALYTFIYHFWYDGIYYMVYINTTDMMLLLMPVYIFQFTFNVDLNTFKAEVLQLLIICTLRLAVEVTLLTLIMHQVFKMDWDLSLQYGSLMAITVPAGIVNIIEGIGRFRFFTILLQTEMVLSITLTRYIFRFTFDLEWSAGWYTILWHLLVYFLGAVLLGLVHGAFVKWLLMHLQKDEVMCMFVIMSNIYLAYGLISEYLLVSPDLYTLVLGLMMSTNNKKYSAKMINYLRLFWSSYYTVMDVMLFVYSLAYPMAFLMDAETFRCYYLMILAYVSTNIVRVLTYICIAPIMNFVNKEADVSTLLLLAFCGLKDSVNMVLEFRIYEYTHKSRPPPTLNMCMVLMSMLINANVMPHVLGVMGLSQISLPKRTNMNNCIRYILERQARYISAMKLNRYLSDADWSTIQRATILRHPYKINVTEDEDVLSEQRVNYCPDCKTEFPMELTSSETKELTTEAMSRIMKAKKISYIRQKENGMLSTEGLTVLLNTVEHDCGGKDQIGLLDKLQRRGRSILRLSKYINSLWVDKESLLPIPQKYYRKICYYIVMNIVFEILMCLNILTTTVITLVIMVLSEHVINNPENYMPMFIIITLCHWMFVLEFMLKVIGLSTNTCHDGMQNYFASTWNVIDFLILVGVCVDQIVMFIHYDSTTNYYGGVEPNLILTIRCLRYVRIIRFFRLIQRASPKVIKYMQDCHDLQKALDYDITKGILVSYEEILNELPKLVEDDTICKIVSQEMQDEKKLTEKHLNRITKERPWVSITIKTKQAIRTTINAMVSAINELKSSGYIDTIEFNKLWPSIEECRRNARKLRIMKPSPPKYIFKEIGWIAGDQALIEYLNRHIKKRSIDINATVFDQEEIARDILIIVTGILSVSYEPKSLKFLGTLRRQGALPIVDFLSSTNFDESVLDFVVSGSSIGELGYLTKRSYSSSVKAEAHSQVYSLSYNVLDQAAELFNHPIFGLRARMWKFAIMDLVIHILTETEVYKSSTQQQIKSILDRAFVPDINHFRSLVSFDQIEDIILVEGLGADVVNDVLYVGPCYIPRWVREIWFYQTKNIIFDTKIKPIVLIIPIKDADEMELMVSLEDTCELMSDDVLQIYNKIVTSTRRRAKKLKQLRRRTASSLQADTLTSGTSFEEISDNFLMSKNCQ